MHGPQNPSADDVHNKFESSKSDPWPDKTCEFRLAQAKILSPTSNLGAEFAQISFRVFVHGPHLLQGPRYAFLKFSTIPTNGREMRGFVGGDL